TDIPVRIHSHSPYMLERKQDGYLVGTKIGTSRVATQVRGHGRVPEPLENQDTPLASQVRPAEYQHRIGLPAVWSPASVVPGTPDPQQSRLRMGRALHGAIR